MESEALGWLGSEHRLRYCSNNFYQSDLLSTSLEPSTEMTLAGLPLCSSIGWLPDEGSEVLIVGLRAESRGASRSF